MGNTSHFNKTKKGFSIVLIVSMIVLMLSSVVFADNVTGPGSGVKAVNVLGYQLDSQNTIEVFLDKGISGLDKGQFRIYNGTTPVTISSMSLGSKGCGWTQADGMQPGGYDVVLTTASNLDYDTEYKMVVSSTVTMGNSFHLSVGNYLQHRDITFYFKTPKSDGKYSGVPKLSFIPGDIGNGTSVPVGSSENIEVISSMPIDTSSLNLSNMKLQESSTLNGTYTDVIFDSTFDYVATTGAEYYAPQINDAHTCIFLPLTLGGGSPAYNLLKSEFYKLTVPTITAANNDDANKSVASTTQPAFYAGGDTSASLGNTQPSVTAYNLGSISLQWTNISAADNSGPVPNGYKVYYSTNPYFDFVDTGITPTNNGTISSATFTNGFQSGTTYYFRIVPVNSTGEEGGFSPYVSQVF